MLQGRLYPFKRVLHAYNIAYVSLLSGFKMHILQIIVLFRRELPTSKGVIPKVCSVVLDEYHIMYLEK